MKFLAQSKNGKLSLGSEENRDRFFRFLQKNQDIKLEIKPLQPESSKQRGFYHGAVLKLWAYLDGADYKDNDKIKQYHEVAKKEFNGEIIKVNNAIHKVGKSTKGQLQEFLDRVVDYLEENYGIKRQDVLDPEKYKYFRDAIYLDGKYDDFIDYMRDIKLLK